jgi:multidrug transporter EmrE-like cation transporter
MAYLHIAISAGLSILIAHILKRNERRKVRTLHVLTLNYAYALAVLPFLLPDGAVMLPSVNSIFILAAGVNGILFILNFFAYSKSVEANGVGLSVAAMRMSLVIPVFYAIVRYGEPLHAGVVVGLAMVVVALALMILRPGIPILQSIQDGRLLVGMFGMSGICDVFIKMYERNPSPEVHDAHFVFTIYLISLLTGLAILAVRKELGFTRDELRMGFLIGIPNLLTFVFMLKALALLPATIAFSLSHLSVVLGGTILGQTVWKDPLLPSQWFGILLALAAILILIQT